MKVVIAVGGNDLIRDTKKASLADQQTTTTETARVIARISREHEVVVTHGNGPQVGFILLRSAAAKLHPIDVDIATADTQAGIGIHFKRGFARVFAEMGVERRVAVVITEVEVDPNDPSMLNPSKPIGPFYTDTATLELMGVPFKEDSRRGYRRVVASPPPLRIREVDQIRDLMEAGYMVVGVGGGGVPVVDRGDGIVEGVAAVIDKDRASALLAKDLGADALAIATAVPHACLNFGKEGQQALTDIRVSEARRYMAEGHFAPGAMLPKIEAMVDFVRATGKVALLTTADKLQAMLAGNYSLGTSIWPDERGGIGG